MTDYKVQHEDKVNEEHHDIGEDLGMTSIWGVSVSFFFICIAISAWLVGVFGKNARVENEIKVMHSNNMTLLEVREEQLATLNTYSVIDAEQGRVSIAIDEAMRLAVRELTRIQRNPPEPSMFINGLESKPVNPCNPCNPCNPGNNPCNPVSEAAGETVGEPGTAHGAAD